MKTGKNMIENLMLLLKRYGLVFSAAAITITPVIWQVASSHYHERIESLKEQIALLKEQKSTLEEKLRQSPLVTQAKLEKPEPLDSPTTSSYPVKETILLPYVADSASPTKNEIRELARFYNLFDTWKINPHLRFEEGDISYWSEQSLTKQKLMLEFETRRTILQQAEISGERILSQGDLSYKAERLQAMSQRP